MYGLVYLYSTFDLEQFANVEEVYGNLQIQFADCADLESGAGPQTIALPNLRVVTGTIEVQCHPMLEVLELPSLETVGTLHIGRNPLLWDLTAVQMPATIGSLRIETMDATMDFSSFASLQTITGSLQLDHMDTQIGLGGFSGLTSVGSLQIFESDALADLSGLSALATVTGDVFIVENDSLPECHAIDFVAGLTVGGTTTIADNDIVATCP